MEKVTGYVTGVNGNLVSARFSGSVRKNEVGFVKIGNDRLKGEVIRISGDAVSMQIYEMTNGIQVGDEVELTGELLSVELGPGLLTQVYDGLQNPLPKLAEQCGFFLERGVYLDPIPDKEWSSPLRQARRRRARGRRCRQRTGGAVHAPHHGALRPQGRGLARKEREGKGRSSRPLHRCSAGKRRGRGEGAEHGLFLAGQAAHPLL